MIKLTYENNEAASEIDQSHFNTETSVTTCSNDIVSNIDDKNDKIRALLHQMEDIDVNNMADLITAIKNTDGLKGEKYILNAKYLYRLRTILNRMVSCINKMYMYVNAMQFTVGERLPDKIDTIDKDFVENTKITYDDNVLHIIYPALMPKKQKTHSKEFNIEIGSIKNTYTAAIGEYFKSHKAQMYDCKVVLCFIHHYSSEHLVRDHDNFSLREIINSLCTYVLRDDNPRWCAHYMDYIVDGSDYSEIYVVPEELFLKGYSGKF